VFALKVLLVYSLRHSLITSRRPPLEVELQVVLAQVAAVQLVVRQVLSVAGLVVSAKARHRSLRPIRQLLQLVAVRRVLLPVTLLSVMLAQVDVICAPYFSIQ
jgi:hypothetical protein